jgi:hypothetical protein
MGRLSRLARGLRQLGLTIEEYPPGARDPRELRVTNPRFPSRGQVVVDRDGLVEWSLLTDITSDPGTNTVVSVIAGLLRETGIDIDAGHDNQNVAALRRPLEIRPHP